MGPTNNCDNEALRWQTVVRSHSAKVYTSLSVLFRGLPGRLPGIIGASRWRSLRLSDRVTKHLWLSRRGRALLLLLCWILLGSLTYATPVPVDEELRALLEKAIRETDSFGDRYDAEVWLVDMAHRLKNRIPDPARRLELLKTLHYEAHRANLSPELVLAVIEVESYFDHYAISVSGAQGLMQIMPFWLKEIGRTEDNLFHIQTNLRMGCTILRHYLNKEGGNLTQALARYNGSLGSNRYPGKVFHALEKRWYRQ